MQGLKLGFSIVFLYSACNILQLTTSEEQDLQSDTAIAQVSDTGNNDSVVYTYSEAIVRDGKPMVSQLTIAKGKDGKNHYARTENGTYKTGEWSGPLPKSPDVSQLVGDMHEITKQLENPLAELNLGIGNTLQDYLQKAFMV
ncbi:hypothetical protein Ocin01_01957 [Orchesella cincta]|uniref:Uncharacterized protein n=1 Tax=Orchesella cincta TaxID=48709 RepID=A0A1D2NID7_ORCCI|nr:hypothetical protein Ocin01_01957 [Orchesella cincta]